MQDSQDLPLARIRSLLRAGTFRPATALSIKGLAVQLRLSPTPVREALAHLAGEGLIVERRGFGYFVENLDAASLIELLDLHLLYMDMAANAVSGRGARLTKFASLTPVADTDPVAATERLFEGLALGAENTVLVLELRRVADRLAPSRQVDAEILGSPIDELNRLAALAAAGDGAGLVAEIQSFHRRRVTVAADIVATLRKGRVS
jgi:hypothetical protein